MIYIIAPCNLDIKRDMIFLFMYALVSAVSARAPKVSHGSSFCECESQTARGRMSCCLGRAESLFLVPPVCVRCTGRPCYKVCTARTFSSAIAKGKCRFVASASRRRSCALRFSLKVPLQPRRQRERNTINTFVRWLLVIQPLCNRVWMEFLHRSSMPEVHSVFQH